MLVSRDCATSSKTTTHAQNIAGISNNVNKEPVFTNSWEIPVESLQIMVRVDWWLWPETNIDLTVSFRLKEGEGVGRL